MNNIQLVFLLENNYCFYKINMYMYQMIHPYKENSPVTQCFSNYILVGKYLHMQRSDYIICIASNDHMFAVVDYLLC